MQAISVARVRLIVWRLRSFVLSAVNTNAELACWAMGWLHLLTFANLMVAGLASAAPDPRELPPLRPLECRCGGAHPFASVQRDTADGRSLSSASAYCLS